MSQYTHALSSATAFADEVLVLSSLAELEGALHSAVIGEWHVLIERDPASTVFQSPDWALPWYRSYSDFEPRLLLVFRKGRLVGLIPLAVEPGSRRITFAGDSMADYRDILALPEHRKDTMAELVRYYRTGGFSSPLVVGPTSLESDTPALLKELADAGGIHAIVRWNNGWRWLPGEKAEDPLKKKSVRYPINYFRRSGILRAARLQRREEWESFKEDFFRQHSLRQIFSGRTVTLDDPRKRAFFDRLAFSPCGHVTALYWNDTLIAGHIGAVFKNVLYWGAPSFDVRQRQYSPNLVLLALTISKRDEWGFPAGMDLTMGKGEVKERFSNSRTKLGLVELYPGARQYYLRKTRTAATTAARNVVDRLWGEGFWEKRLRPAVEIALAKLKHASEAGPAKALLTGLSMATRLIGEYKCGIVFVAQPEDSRNVEPTLGTGENLMFHDNDIYTFLNRDRWDDGCGREIGNMIRQYADLLRSGRTVHTVTINGKLAAWGCSYYPSEPASLSEAGGAPLEFLPNSVSLYAFYTVPEFRGRGVNQILLSHILAQRFAEGAARAYISAEASNLASRTAIERVGFRGVITHRWIRLFKWSWLRSRPA
jgi:CelD/BcsL family acetyltransferase involved in cellulose biosynthesis/GNAT superfamily N-acetyltransferase